MPFENPLLDKLLRGILERRPIEVKTNLIEFKEIEAAIGSIPISLSENQHNALVNAWQSEISYIQGPPGTGKSHTITALLLSAIFLKKRVLMVSHKKAAVDVVRHQVEKFLGQGSIVFLSSQKRELRGQLQKVCQEATTFNALRRVAQMSDAVKTIERDVESLTNEIEHISTQIKNCLANEQNYYQFNERFLQHRKSFAEDFSIEASPERFKLATKVSKPENYRKHLSVIHSWLQEKRIEQSGYLARKEWLHVLRVFNQAQNVFFADRQKLKPTPVATLYLTEHLELTLKHEKTAKAREKISDDFLLQQRQLLSRREDKLLRAKEGLIRLLYAYNVENNLLKTSCEIEKYDKMLHWRAPHIIRDCMEQIDFNIVTKTFPLWVGEMRNLGAFLPFASQLFDMVVVDEASQVNIAEIIPAFYRGSRFCVVGDKKQLGLNSAGLFSLNRTFEQLIWNQYFGLNKNTISYDEAKERDLLVSESSILDFITGERNQFTTRKATLNEHFRSLPQLASFTSDTFYSEEGGLRLMKELPKHLRKKCFCAIEVGGKRESEFKVVPTEVEALVKQLRDLIRGRSYVKDPILSEHGFKDENGERPTIGVISFLTYQRNYIRLRLEEEFSEDELAAYSLMVGTPEDFQGNERHIIFITFGLDGTGSWSKSHYENPERFNVATSRAICFTCAIFGGIPETASLIKKYLRHFGVTWKALPSDADAKNNLPALQRYAWRYRPELRESEFEIRVDEYLNEFIKAHGGNECLELFNQVESCGQKRLDFVLFNKINGECSAVEVDGQDHFTADGQTYSEAHLERIGILKRAGWKIVHVPYYRWYRGGWLCDKDDKKFKEHLKDLFQELRSSLFISVA